MPKKAAGILLYRLKNKTLEVLLVHPGGPFWMKKDLASWSIPKGELNDDEDLLEGAKREFHEEMGTPIDGDFIALTPAKGSNKTLYTFALEHDFDVSTIKSNMFSLEWPPKSGKTKEFPEIDRGEWFDYETALTKINKYQVSILEELRKKVK